MKRVPKKNTHNKTNRKKLLLSKKSRFFNIIIFCLSKSTIAVVALAISHSHCNLDVSSVWMGNMKNIF